MIWKIILGITIVLILCLTIVKIEQYINEKVTEKAHEARQKLSEKIYGKSYNSCKSLPTTESNGIIADSIIVCRVTENLPATPVFYYELFPSDFMVNGWCFVNLDMTDFSKYEEERSPHFMICKTRQAYDILSKKFPHKEVIYTGFTSIDRYDSNVKKDFTKFIHIAGKSHMKGTMNLLKYWLDHPEWPELTVICRSPHNNKILRFYNDKVNSNNSLFKNVKMLSNFLTEDQLNLLSNQNGIHICCSETEGFGHYLHEAKAMASVVLYTDAPPMNETFIDDYNGISIDCKQNGFRNDNICPVYNITKEGLEKAINKVLNTSIEELELIGKRARVSFLDEREQFKKRLISAINGTEKIPKIIHHIWISKQDHYKDVNYPEKNVKYIKTWKKHNPEFTYMYWSGNKILNLLKTHFPQFLDYYKELVLISKCDFARFVVTYLYGGLYLDNDFICRKNFSNLLQGDSYFIFEPKEHMNKVAAPVLCNGFFALSPRSKIAYEWLIMMTNSNSKDVMTSNGPIQLCKYATNTKNKMLFGDTCKVLSVMSDKNNSIAKQCIGNYNNYTVTLWLDGSGWGNDYDGITKNYLVDKIKLNPINNSEIIMLSYLPHDTGINFSEKFDTFLKEQYIVKDPYEAIYFAHALDNMKASIPVYFLSDNTDVCNMLEKLGLVNSLSNLYISYGSLWYNFLDGSTLVWEMSNYTKENQPGPEYKILDKRQIFDIAKKLQPNSNIIDSHAHIGDLSIPLAKALANCGRSDITVYAIEPSKEKCDFIKRIASYNELDNIIILNSSLSDIDNTLNINKTNSYIHKWDENRYVIF